MAFTFIDLFAGIGGIRIPFDELGGKCVFSSEWDVHAADTYEANFGERPHGDITKIREADIPKHDILLGGFPCQAFSIMGKMQGFADTRGTMFFEIERILKYHKPKAILLENVKQLVGHDKGRTFEVIQKHLAELGYHVKWKVLNALDFGVPQRRERVIIVGFRNRKFAERMSLDFDRIPYNLSDVLEDEGNVDPSLFASKRIVEKRRKSVAKKDVFFPSVWHENKSGNISVLPHACALRTGASYNYQLVNGNRRFTDRELFRLQGFPDTYKVVGTNQDVRRQTGNAVCVNVIRAVATRMLEILYAKA
ncbi:MAG: DNA (cytosine-5-)-methyltransferase [Fibrobacter sp.]|nr:DNA (cytosine-5-)-methyltransferase [Fibrobacter sp.]